MDSMQRISIVEQKVLDVVFQWEMLLTNGMETKATDAKLKKMRIERNGTKNVALKSI